MKRALISYVLGAALMTSSVAVAAAPLAPGKAAGVQKAQSFVSSQTALWVLGAGVVIGGVLLVAGNGSNGHPGTVSTCNLDGTCPGGGGSSGTGPTGTTSTP